MLHKVCGSVQIDTDLSFPYYIGELGAQRKLEPEGLQGIKVKSLTQEITKQRVRRINVLPKGGK